MTLKVKAKATKQVKPEGPTKVLPPQHSISSKAVKKKIVAVNPKTKIKLTPGKKINFVKKMSDTCNGQCNCPDCKIKGSLTHHKTAKTAGIDVNDLAAGVRVANGLNY